MQSSNILLPTLQNKNIPNVQVEELQLSDSTDRDLSSWKISIPAVRTKRDPSNKPYSVFYIDVQKADAVKEGMLNRHIIIDMGSQGSKFLDLFSFHPVVEDGECEGSHWTVERRYTDFYALEAKLTEFHGEFHDNQLPPRRMALFSAPSAQFLESRKQVCTLLFT